MTTHPHLAIEAEGLVKRFEPTTAVDGVDLAVRAGERQLDTERRPSQQIKSDEALQATDLPAQCRLRDEQPRGGAAEVELVGDGDEGPQLPEFDRVLGEGIGTRRRVRARPSRADRRDRFHMTSAVMPTSSRVAVVLLRGDDWRVRAHVHWPSRRIHGGVPPLLVLFNDGPDDRDDAAELCSLLRVVALSATPATLTGAIATMEWAADHAADLGADEQRLIIAGKGTGTDVAAAASLHTRHNRWPHIARQVLIAPSCDRLPERLLAVAAPTTIVTIGDDRRLPVWARHGGTAVEHLHEPTEATALGALADSLGRVLDAPSQPAALGRWVR